MLVDNVSVVLAQLQHPDPIAAATRLVSLAKEGGIVVSSGDVDKISNDAATTSSTTTTTTTTTTATSAALSFLEWFCAAVGPRNYIAADELTRYAELAGADGADALTGRELNDALTLLHSATVPGSLAALEKEVAELEAAARLEEEHASALNAQVVGMRAAAEAAARQADNFRTAVEVAAVEADQMTADGTRIDMALTSLTSAASQLAKQYTAANTNTDTDTAAAAAAADTAAAAASAAANSPRSQALQQSSQLQSLSQSQSSPLFLSHATQEAELYEAAESEVAHALAGYMRCHFHNSFLAQIAAKAQEAAETEARVSRDASACAEAQALSRLRANDAAEMRRAAAARIEEQRTHAALNTITRALRDLGAGGSSNVYGSGGDGDGGRDDVRSSFPSPSIPSSRELLYGDASLATRHLAERRATIDALESELGAAHAAVATAAARAAEAQPTGGEIEKLGTGARLELARQQYLALEQQRLVHILLQQKARREILAAALGDETRVHQTARDMIHEASIHVGKMADAFEGRIAMVTDFLGADTATDAVGYAECGYKNDTAVAGHNHHLRHVVDALGGLLSVPPRTNAGKSNYCIEDVTSALVALRERINWEKRARSNANARRDEEAALRAHAATELQRLLGLTIRDEDVLVGAGLVGAGGNKIEEGGVAACSSDANTGTPLKPTLSPQLLTANLALLEASLDGVVRDLDSLARETATAQAASTTPDAVADRETFRLFLNAPDRL